MVYFRFFRLWFQGRDRASAGEGLDAIPPHSLAFRPECHPSDVPPNSRRAHTTPGLARGLLRKGSCSADEGGDADLAELDPRGEWLPPKRNTRARSPPASRQLAQTVRDARLLAYRHKTNSPRPPPARATGLVGQFKFTSVDSGTPVGRDPLGITPVRRPPSNPCTEKLDAAALLKKPGARHKGVIVVEPGIRFIALRLCAPRGGIGFGLPSH